MNKFFSLRSLCPLFVCFILSGCLEKNNETIVLPEISGKVSEVALPKEIRAEFESKMTIYEGTNPPRINYSFVVSPNSLVFASDNYEGTIFDDRYISFYDVSKSGRRCKYKSKQSSNTSTSATVDVVGRW